MLKHCIGAVVVSMLTSGCADSAKSTKAMKSFGETCQGTISAELRVTTWGNDLVLKCDKFQLFASEDEKK